MSTSGESVRTFTLAPLFNFLISFFIPKQENTANTNQQSHQPQSNPSKFSKPPKMWSPSSESIRTFTLALHKYIHTLSDTPANIGSDMIEILQSLKDALSDHEDILNELNSLHYNETDFDKRLLLSQSLERGRQTNAVIVKFIWDCCHDGHPRGLLKHGMKTAFFSDRIVRATDEQLSVAYAYKAAIGEALLWD